MSAQRGYSSFSLKCSRRLPSGLPAIVPIFLYIVLRPNSQVKRFYASGTSLPLPLIRKRRHRLEALMPQKKNKRRYS